MIDQLAQYLGLGSLLKALTESHGGYEVLDLWQQGEFHNDLLLRVDATASGLPGRYLLVATNCNGGVKELMCFNHRPQRGALWHARCPESTEFSGALPSVLASCRTVHWIDPRQQLGADAPSEYRAEFRERQRGGGWRPVHG